MATSTSIPIKNSKEIKPALQILLNVAEENFPLKKLKRLCASMMEDDQTDQKLEKLGEVPNDLRKELKFIMERDSIYIIKKFENYFSSRRFDSDVSEYITRHVPAKERIIWEYDEDSWGDAFPGSFDTEITTNHKFIILTFDDGNPSIRLLEVEEVEDVFMSDRDMIDMKIVNLKEELSLYQIISLHPKLIERIVLILGSYEELLRHLK
jgi:hypothetical protein